MISRPYPNIPALPLANMKALPSFSRAYAAF